MILYLIFKNKILRLIKIENYLIIGINLELLIKGNRKTALSLYISVSLNLANTILIKSKYKKQQQTKVRKIAIGHIYIV